MTNILQLSSSEVRTFFLKSENYCNVHLPEYFDFQLLLEGLSKCKSIKGGIPLNKAKKIENVNYLFLTNKDGKYAWRPFQLINPVIYVYLVNTITEDSNWDLIVKRFRKFQKNKSIECCSIPIVSDKSKQDTIYNWWNQIEQKSIEYALDYNCFMNTDIVECYSSIYTHSIPWALHGRCQVKNNISNINRKSELVGDKLDRIIQSMQFAQTNGIPQGSAIMDFIGEIVLGYADAILNVKIKKYNRENEDKIENYKILRYRDDYRIFAIDEATLLKIAKLLTETLMILNLKLNNQKTFISHNIIKDAIKPDKIYWTLSRQGGSTLQKHLLILHLLAEKFPNSGALQKAMDKFLDRIYKIKNIGKENPKILMSILIDIAYQNPRTYPTIIAILSKIFSIVKEDNEILNLLGSINKKFDKIPNIGHFQIWLQRLTLKIESKEKYKELLCQKVLIEDIKIWNFDWIDIEIIRQIIDNSPIINRDKINSLPSIIEPKEVQIFKKYIN